MKRINKLVPLGGTFLHKTAGKPGRRTMTIYDVYASICNETRLTSRLAEGGMGLVTMEDTGWLVKEDLPGMPPQVEHEVKIYELLEEAGLMGDIVPEVDFNESYGGVLRMRLINMGAPLYEYARSRHMTAEQWQDLCEAVGLVIRQFHDEGFIHHDLHDRNIVVEVKGGKWHPVIIDFGVSTHSSLECDHLSREFWDETPEDDVSNLVGTLTAQDDTPAWLLKGIERLERAALCA